MSWRKLIKSYEKALGEEIDPGLYSTIYTIVKSERQKLAKALRKEFNNWKYSWNCTKAVEEFLDSYLKKQEGA